MLPKPDFSEDELVRRRPVWDALSDLFLDTDSRLFEDAIAARLIASGYSADELETILVEEVHPILRINVVLWEWISFDQAWLERKIRRRRTHWLRLPTSNLLARLGWRLSPIWRRIRHRVSGAHAAAVQRGMALLLFAVLALTLPQVAHAQRRPQPIRVTIGFGVDSVAATEREILTTYRAYLAQQPSPQRPNPHWSRAEQEQWPVFDLLSGYLYQGFTSFTVVHLAPAVGLDSTYLIRTLISSVSDTTREVRPLALYNMYAVREAGRWVLANALPRQTRTWRRETLGRVTFVYPPTHEFDRPAAEASAAFVDSLAAAFSLTPPPSIGYYFSADLLETFRVMGLDYFPLGADTVGGRSLNANRLVFVGSSSHGEGYRHELAHVVLQPFIGNTRPANLVIEGIMTWTGGSAGLSFAELLPGLRRYLEAHPALTLQMVLAEPPPRVGTLDVGYDGTAVLCAMLFERGGVPAIRSLVRAGNRPSDVLASARRTLGVDASRLDQLWRSRITETP